MRSLWCRPLLRALVLAGAVGSFGAGAGPAQAQGSTPTVGGVVTGLLGVLTGGGAPPAPLPPAPPPTPDPCGAAPVSGDTSIVLTSGGLTRTAVLHLPAAPAGKPLALIVAFHGQGGNGPAFAVDSGLSTLANQYGYAVVYPSAVGSKWIISGPLDRDVGLASELIDRVESSACIDHRRVFATGVSIGAGMAARVGCELSERIAALVLVAGGYRSLNACRVDRPMSVLEIHGTSDSTVPYHGQGPGYDGAVLPYIEAWAKRDRCGPTPTKTLVAAHTVRYRWSGCASGVIVEHLRIYGSGHGLPNAPGSEISSGHSNISGVRNIWHFLAARSLAHPFDPPDQH